MMRSLYSGVSGLKTHQTKMDVIGNNIANVNTTAYKSSSISFSELMYQTTQKASGPNASTGTGGTNARQIGLGVKSAAISTAISTQGATQSTGNPFDVCMTGSNFFVVSNGSENYFTRSGAFTIDANGNLVMTANGYNVMGWQVDEETNTIKKDTVSALRIMSSENMTYPPEATSKGYVSGILDKNDTDVATESGKALNFSFYDNLGYSYNARFSIHTTTTEGEYYVQLDDILDSNGLSITEKYPGTVLSDLVMINDGGSCEPEVSDTYNYLDTVEFNGTELQYKDAAGVTQSFNLATNGTYDAATGDYTLNMNDTVKGYIKDCYGNNVDTESILAAKVSSDGTLVVTKKTVTGVMLDYNTDNGKFSKIAGTDSITLNFNTNITGTSDWATKTPPESLQQFKDVEISWKTTSMFNNSGTSTLGAKSGDTDNVGAGRKLGNMSGITIQTNGMIYASYDNGMTRLMGQIATAEFSNPEGLEKVGDNLYSATLNSGEFDGVGVDVTASGGYMTTGALEMSNVDLSTEFTEMITTQRGFQANSRIITVSDTMLEELVNLKR